MRESSQLVRIERHRLEGDLVVLTFMGRDEPAADNESAVETPLVFVQHGLGSRKERHLDLCLRLAEAGFRACSLDARHHGDRATAEMRRRLADIHSLEFLQAFTETVQGTVQDIKASASYFGADAYGLIGHSMGGFVALHTALADPHVAAVVSIAGALPLSPPDGVTYPAEITEGIRWGDLAARAERFWPRPVLLLHGADDTMVPLLGSERLHDALIPYYTADPERLRLTTYTGVGHELTPEMASAAVDWTRHYRIAHG